MPEVFETTWPDKSFAQFGGHVLERLFATHDALANRVDNFRHSSHGETPADQKRYTVRVTIEITPTGNVASHMCSTCGAIHA